MYDKLFSLDGKELVLQYLPLAKFLHFESEETFHSVSRHLLANITRWAKAHSNVYKHHVGVMEKYHLADKGNWFTSVEGAVDMATNGTMTGSHFHYRRWDSTLLSIEVDNHYKMILEEFEIPPEPKVIYFINNIYREGGIYQVMRDCDNFTEKHGADRAEVHFINKQDEFDDNFFDIFFSIEPVDVLLVSGQYLNYIVREIKKRGIKRQIATLLSNTNEWMDPEDAEFMLKNNYVQKVCDHMRCWDGGAGFFQCRHGTYHLMDNLAYCYQGLDKKLISTDYCNLASPFVNYWNGDYCEIEGRYSRCACGRLYRPFKFVRSRPFSFKGMCIETWREGFREANIAVKSVDIDATSVRITPVEMLSKEEKMKIREIMQGFTVFFYET